MPAPSPNEIQRIALLIEAEARQLKEFIDLLALEEALLVTGDTDGLNAITQEKTERHRQLQRLHDDRAMLLGRCGLRDTADAVRILYGNMPRVLARWEEVLKLAERARARNATNGQLIGERMNHAQAALSVLLAAANHPQLYDAGGHARPSGGGRILGSA
ncbi:MAG: flagellar protein FlgN [Azoarcus sp.]|jgi:flagella synthesis protein FlgN|nr:flagellar protein FlgN [Azoarcus sp.]